MVRGIQNVSGVSCHVSCALQILCHTVPPLSESLIYLHSTTTTTSPSSSANKRNESSTLLELGRFFAALVRDEDCSDDPADPTLLYQALEKVSSINQHNVGDSSNAIYKVLDMIRKCVAALASNNEEGGRYRGEGKDRNSDSSRHPNLLVSNKWTKLCERCIFGGTTRQTIMGRKRHDEKQNTIIVQTKHGKIKEMAVPFPLVGKFESIPMALQIAFGDQVVAGYQWNRNTNNTGSSSNNIGSNGQGLIEEEQGREDEASYKLLSDVEWRTCKTLHLESLPMFWILHVERFSYADGEKILSNPKVDIPFNLDLSLYCNGAGIYSLRGGILHVSDDGNIEEEGHYVAFVRVTAVSVNSTGVHHNWVMIDDEKCQLLTETDVIEMAGGTFDAKGRHLCATLLVYGGQSDGAAQEEMDQLLSDLKHDISEAATVEQNVSKLLDDTLNEQVVGRRLRVRWAKGRFYAGIVVSYDPSSRMHRVQYDDGDIKEYNLTKKTIEWEK